MHLPGEQIIILFILAVPVACISWTVTHEEVFSEMREYFVKRYNRAGNIFTRKLFYLFTCEYCFSHYVTVLFLFITEFTIIFSDWRGYLISGFSLVWVANIYMSIYNRIRLDIKREKVDIEANEKEIKKNTEQGSLLQVEGNWFPGLGPELPINNHGFGNNGFLDVEI